MSADRELLEAAAEAAGIAYEHMFGGYYTDPEFNEVVAWNPLTDDGDALRLAVKLCMQVQFGRGWQHASVYGCDEVFSECHDGRNADDATRRAIVRAAAALKGKT